MAIEDATSKACISCGEVKPLDEYYPKALGRLGRTGRCKTCLTAYNRAWNAKQKEKDSDEARARLAKRRKAYRESNANKIYIQQKAYREKNKEALAKKKKEFYEKNKEKILSQQKQKYIETAEQKRQRQKEYAERTGAHKRQYERRKKRIEDDPIYAMRNRVRLLILYKIKCGGYTKKSKTQEILGCDWSFFKTHIERQFLKGMTWENRSMWHIDHIVPISTAKTEEDVIRLNHYTNLRPLWAADNMSKGGAVVTLL